MNVRSVAIVGMGVVSPAGSGLASFWQGLLSCRSFVTRLDISAPDLPLIASVVDDDARPDVLSHAEHRRFDRICDLGISAAQEAADDAGLPQLGVEPERLAIVAGIGFGGISTLTSQYDILRTKGWRRGSPFGIPTVMPSAVASLLSIRFGARGPVSTVSSACTSGLQAIVEGTRLIRAGYADVVLAGGAEAPVNLLALAGFTRMDAMSRRVTEPQRASRPFDVDRDGFVLGEGSAFVVLRRADHARKSGARVYGFVAGTGFTSDGSHMTIPDRHGGAASRCMSDALSEASCQASVVAHVNAHGTGTPLNDEAESRAIRTAFGPAPPPVTSCKGAIGHLMGAAGAVEFVATVLSMDARTVPATVNCDQIDPKVGLDIVKGCARQIPLGPALTCSFGFGGQNAAVVVTPDAPPWRH